jgi:endonuclease YncB( thermonuclease family)
MVGEALETPDLWGVIAGSTNDSWSPSMALASRIVSILLGLAVVGLLLWPINIPLGFGQAWWAREIAANQQAPAKPAQAPTVTAAMPEPANPPAPPPQAEAPRAAQAEPAAQPHALGDPGVSKPTMLAAEKAEAERLAALQKDRAEAAKTPPPTKRYFKVRVVDAGTIETGGTVITLAGIVARDAKAKCKDGRGKDWACGAAARIALTKLIRSRAVICTLPKEGEQKAFAAQCSVAGTDLATWVVRQGWASPKDTQEQALADAETAAKKSKVGMWRGGDTDQAPVARSQ